MKRLALVIGAAIAAMSVTPLAAVAQETVEQWAQSAVVVGDDEQVGWTDEGVSLIRSGSIRSLGNGHQQIGTRFEFQRAYTSDGATYRSLASTYDFDCAAHTVRATRRLAYAANNLGGHSQDIPGDDSQATFDSESILATLYQHACGGGGQDTSGGGSGGKG